MVPNHQNSWVPVHIQHCTAKLDEMVLMLCLQIESPKKVLMVQNAVPLVFLVTFKALYVFGLSVAGSLLSSTS
jgi:hypothetical protein